MEKLSQLELPILYGIQRIVQQSGAENIITSIFIFFTKLGDYGLLWFLLGICLLVPKKTRRWGVATLLSLVFGFVIGNVVIKNIVMRTRPYLMAQFPIIIPPPGEYSFPSGHTLSSFGAATVLFLNHKKTGIIAYLVAILIGFSRLFLFVHFPSDVIAGACLGILIGNLSNKYSKKYAEILPFLDPTQK